MILLITFPRVRGEAGARVHPREGPGPGLEVP